MSRFQAHGAESKTQTRHTTFSRLMATSALVAVCTLSVIGTAPAADVTLPVNGQVVAGTSVITNPAVGYLQVDQSTDRTVINWDSFNIGSDATVQFNQLSSSSLAVNRVVGAGQDPTKILGTLRANGNVMVLDRNGVLFGKNAVVDVGGIIASTGDVSTTSIMDKSKKITLSNVTNGSIVNEGNITVSDYGMTAFVAPSVQNSGVINAKLGKVSLAAGIGSATVDLYGDGLVLFSPAGTSGKVLAENSGTINALGGVVRLTASAAKDVVDQTVNMSGVINASSASVVGGKIILSAKKVNITKTAKLKADLTTVAANTVDLDATIEGIVKGSAKTVNVQSNNAKIMQAMNIIDTNGVINVGAGIYDEDLVISKAGVTLNGNRAGVAGNDASRSADETILTPHSPGIVITTSNVTVDGLTINGASNAIEVKNANNVTLKNNILTNSSENGVYATGSSGLTVSNSVIDTTGAHGIYLLNSVGAHVLGNDIGLNGGAGNIQGDGIRLAKAHNAIISGNHISNIAPLAYGYGNGIYSAYSNNVMIGGLNLADGNVISHTAWDGIKVFVGNNITVQNNTTDYITRAGIAVSNTAGTTTVLDNTLLNSGMWGIWSTQNTGVKLLANTITNTGDHGIFDQRSVGSLIANNQIGVLGSDGNIEGDGIRVAYSDGEEISGNTIANTKPVVGTGYGSGVYAAYSNNAFIHNNTISNAAWDGVKILSGNNNHVTGNTIHDVARAGIAMSDTNNSLLFANGISNTGIWGIWSYTDVDFNMIANTINNTGSHGIYDQYSTGSNIFGNDIGLNGGAGNIQGDGIRTAYSDGLEIGANLIANTDPVKTGYGSGVYAAYSNNISVHNNTIANTAWDGVKILSGDNNRVTGNIIHDVARAGVAMSDTSNSLVDSNIMGNLGIWGVWSYGNTNLMILGNDITNAGKVGIHTQNDVGLVQAGNIIH